MLGAVERCESALPGLAVAPWSASIVGKRYIIHGRAVDNIRTEAQMTKIPVHSAAWGEVERVDGGVVVDGILVEEIAAVEAGGIEAEAHQSGNAEERRIRAPLVEDRLQRGAVPVGVDVVVGVITDEDVATGAAG